MTQFNNNKATHLLIYDSNLPTVKQYDLSEQTQDLHLSSTQGSEGVHLCLKSDDKIIDQLQITTRPNETITLQINETLAKKKITLVTNKQRIQLPQDELYLPAPAFLPQKNGKLDVLFIIDATLSSTSINLPGRHENTKEATAHNYQEENLSLTPTPFLFDNPQFTEQLAQQCHSFLENLTQTFPDIHYACLAFADIPIRKNMANVAKDLRPVYCLRPGEESERYFAAWNDSNPVGDQIKHIKSSTGGDYVDALADALYGSLTYPWRNNARKLAFVIGDSPGFSILSPPPAIRGILGNAAVRHHDVESAAVFMHKQEIECMTLYMTDNSKLEQSINELDRLRVYSKRQYERLATLDSYAFTWESWNAKQAANNFQQCDHLLGHGYCYPQLIRCD